MKALISPPLVFRTALNGRSRTTIALFSCVALSLQFSARATEAQAPATQSPSTDDARTLFLRGQSAYNQGDYETATRVWQEAYAKDPKPLLQFNLAQAYEKLGRLEQAVASLDKYLATAAPGDSHQADARAKIGLLKERLRQTGVRIVGGPEGARIMVDNKDWGFTPRPDPIPVSPGSHRVRLTHKGHQDFSSMVAVSAGQQVDVPVEMLALAATPVTPVMQTQPKNEPEKSSSNIVPYVLLGAGGAAFVTGVVLGLVAMNKAKNANASEGSQASSAKTLGLIADISMGTGLIAAGIGGGMLIFGGSASKEQAPANSHSTSNDLPPPKTAQGPSLRVAPVMLPLGAGAMAHVTF